MSLQRFDRVSVETAQQASINLFVEKVWPVIQDHTDYKALTIVEGATDPTLHILDQLAGIDYYMMTEEGALASLASRVQSDGNDWQTFTIRRSCISRQVTEWQKRVDAYLSDHVRPTYTSQAYMKGDEILSMALIRTDDLIRVALSLKEKRQLPDQTVSDGAFWYVPWHKLERYLVLRK